MIWFHIGVYNTKFNITVLIWVNVAISETTNTYQNEKNGKTYNQNDGSVINHSA